MVQRLQFMQPETFSLTCHQTKPCMVKFDFKNAFNSSRRDIILEATWSFAPDIFPLAYSIPTLPLLTFSGVNILFLLQKVSSRGNPRPSSLLSHSFSSQPMSACLRTSVFVIWMMFLSEVPVPTS